MATLGSSPGSWTNWQYYGSNTYGQVCTGLYTMPAGGGVVTAVSFYADSNSGTTNFAGCVWNSGGGLIVASSEVGLGAGSELVGGQNWHTFGVASTYIPGGTQIKIGWWRTPTGSMLYSYGSGSADLDGNPGSPGSLSGLTSLGGGVGAFIDYNPVSAPTATTNPATSVGSTSAVLNGSVGDGGLSAAGGGSTNCDFNISTSPSGSPNSPVGSTPSTFTGSASPTATVTGLTPNTTYYYQVASYGPQGTTFGAWVAFSTVGICGAPILTSPAAGSAQNLVTGGVTFDWTYENGGASGTQTGYCLAVTAPSGTTYYWTGSAWTTTLTWVSSATQSAAVTAAQWTLGVGTFTWTVANEDANGQGPFATGVTLISEGPPNAPALGPPASSSYSPLGTPETPTFVWAYNPSNAVGGQTGWAFRRKLSGGSSYSYWNSGTNAWQSTVVVNSGSIQTYTFPSGAWVDGNTYNWSVQTQDAGGLGPFASDFVVVAQALAVVTVTAPSGTIHQTSPVVTWTVSFPSGAGQTSYQVRTFSAAQYGAGGFDPATSPATDDSGQVGASSGTSYTVASILSPSTSFRSYVQVTETGSEPSGFLAYGSFTVGVDEPPTPVLTATATTDGTTGAPAVELAVQAAVNLLTTVDASFETGIGSYAPTNCALSQSATHALDGTYSLEMAASAAGTMSAVSRYYPVLPSTQYSALASFIAGATARSVEVSLLWYTSSDALISTSTGTAVADSTGGFTQASVTATSPSTAAYAIIRVTVLSAASGEIHYVDEAGIFPGAGLVWSAGGMLGSAAVVITRSDGLYVRGASAANPLPISQTTQAASVEDEEVGPGVAYTYTAILQAEPATSLLQSPPTSPQGASVTATDWWLLDPLNLPSATAIVVTGNTISQTEQSGVHYPTGSPAGINYPVVVSSGFNGLDGTLSVTCLTAAAYVGLAALLTSGRTLFLSSPFGDALYGHIGPMPGGMSSGMGNMARQAALHHSTAENPYRVVNVTWIGQPRPAV